MVTENKEPAKVKEPKMVPLGELISFKTRTAERDKELKARLADLEKKNASLESDLRIATVESGDDDEVKTVKGHLLDRKRALEKGEEEYNKKLASFSERERKVRAKELATRYEIDVELLEGEDDIEGKSLELWAEKLAEREKAISEKETVTPGAGSVFESMPAATSHKMPHDMVKADGTVDTEALAETRKRLMPK